MFHFSYPHSPLSLFPLISLHVFPPAFSTPQRDSPEVEDNPSSERRVFHVLGRVLPTLFPRCRYLYRLHGLLLSLTYSILPSLPFYLLCLTNVYVLLHYGAHQFWWGCSSLCLDIANTTQTPGSRSISRTDCCSGLLYAVGVSEEPREEGCFRGLLISKTT